METYLRRFIEEVENDRFYEAHEVLETYWHTIRKRDHPLKNLCKGFINGATAFELLKRGNEEGAFRLWSTYEKYLPLMEEGIENYSLFKRADRILQKLKAERLPGI
ncbi:MAG: hypothetical protein B6D59_00095 [Campylobacteraceae bacterium 4484_4]|nr:MAG: hypothetical protein B6D59_00095 [Campylobacteraceae bacterium 4484_4]